MCLVVQVEGQVGKVVVRLRTRLGALTHYFKKMCCDRSQRESGVNVTEKKNGDTVTDAEGDVVDPPGSDVSRRRARV